ncbi:hypothetical protein [Colwellia sp. 75C3]|uniref:hypothetical protein n=1 Tax=Colwellia sp. 75C3 TaxID=888425 RepID=UPI0018E2C625|nr:hypothetical protein [Colwellia sp. 75C3]
MKESIDEVKNELKSKLLYWNNLKSRKIKAGVILVFIGVIVLKIFTTVLTFDWVSGLFT